MTPTRNSYRAVHSAGLNLEVREFWGSLFSVLLIIMSTSNEFVQLNREEYSVGTGLCRGTN